MTVIDSTYEILLPHVTPVMMSYFIFLLRVEEFFFHIGPRVGLTDVSLVAVLEWDFVDTLIFQVDLLFCAA